MRRLVFLIAGAALALAVLAPVVASDGGSKFEASLNGYLETPSVSTAGSGFFHARVKHDSIEFSLSYRNLTLPPAVAHIHFGRPDTAGGVSVFLCGGGGRDDCPASGTVTGKIVPTDVVGPAGQGITTGEFAELVRAMRHGATYVNVHTPPNFPLGEIRGNIRRD